MSLKIPRPSINISRVIYHARLFNPKNPDVLSMNHDQLAQAVAQLRALLRTRQIEHLLVGGVTVLQYVEMSKGAILKILTSSSPLPHWISCRKSRSKTETLILPMGNLVICR